MKIRYTLLLSISIFLSISLFSQSAQSSTTIIQISDLSNDQNMTIYQNSRSSQDLVFVNSCEDLGLIVFDHPTLSQEQAKDAIISFLSGSIDKSKIIFKSNYSKNQVNIDCRAEKTRTVQPQTKIN